MGLLILLPQQREGDPLAAKLAVNLTPVGHRKPGLARHRPCPRKQPPLELGIVKRLRQRPRKPRLLGAADVPLHRRRRQLQAAGNRPTAQTRDMVQPQDLSYFAHRQPLVRHRVRLPKGREDPTVSRLSRVAQLRGSDPSHRSSEHPKSDHFANGIGDHLALEWLITLEWNRWPLCRGMGDHFALEYAVGSFP